MKITITSDLHNTLPEPLPFLSGGDMLIVGGDLTGSGRPEQYDKVFDWIDGSDYHHKILIGGNHDTYLESDPPDSYGSITYLRDSSVNVENLVIWGTARSLTFDGINPQCMAFTGSEEDLEGFMGTCPASPDIVISHGPAYSVLDGLESGGRCGSRALLGLVNFVRPRLLVTGHIHEAYGTMIYKNGATDTFCVNASRMTRSYKAINKPIDIEMIGNKCRVINAGT